MTTAAPSPSPRRFRIGPQLIAGASVVVVLGIIATVWYLLQQQKYVFTDNAHVEAPLIKLTPQHAGPLKRVTVNAGDWLYGNESVARVGDEMIMTQVPGIAVTVQQDIGAMYTPGQAVVTMVEPKELRIVARIDEDKGLKDIFVGQKAYFTVDAFGSKQYEGTVDVISQTNAQGDIVFNISDKREVKQFDVKIRYDNGLYPELQNGMSARVWIVK